MRGVARGIQCVVLPVRLADLHSIWCPRTHKAHTAAMQLINCALESDEEFVCMDLHFAVGAHLFFDDPLHPFRFRIDDPTLFCDGLSAADTCS